MGKDLFDYKTENIKPLSERMRPITFKDFFGQDHLIGFAKPLRKVIEMDKMPSMILWGPPGCGKTTLARIIANMTKSEFKYYSAAVAGKKEVQETIEKAKENLKHYNKRTILFIDEIHRFNKAQQDTFLPYVEDGTLILIGATTENPSFEINSPLLSRMKVFTLNRLDSQLIMKILERALNDTENGLGAFKVEFSKNVLEMIAEISDGDARVALNGLEFATLSSIPDKDGIRKIDEKAIEEIFDKGILRYDKTGEEHYNLISAFHKSLRGSDVDAALYWLYRMLEGGEDPLYIARRMVRFASEDIGNADPQAIQLAINAKQTVEFIGMPECDLALAQAAVYLATAPKSNSIYITSDKVKAEIKRSGSLPVPLDIRNPVTKLMKDLGYGKDYKYPHDYEDAIVKQEYLPTKIRNKKFYKPIQRGFEREIKKRLDYWRKLKEKK
jgi:putative ATPase